MSAASKPVDFDELYPGRFLKAGLLPQNGLTLTISDVDREELEGDKGKKVKGYLSFADHEMQLVLNKTNGLCLKAMFGPTLSAWIGKRITLFRAKWDGEDCIRIWGSPDIEGDLDVQIALPRKRPFTMKLRGRKVQVAAQPASRSQRHDVPGKRVDVRTGEVRDDMDPEPDLPVPRAE